MTNPLHYPGKDRSLDWKTDGPDDDEPPVPDKPPPPPDKNLPPPGGGGMDFLGVPAFLKAPAAGPAAAKPFPAAAPVAVQPQPKDPLATTDPVVLVKAETDVIPSVQPPLSGAGDLAAKAALKAKAQKTLATRPPTAGFDWKQFAYMNDVPYLKRSRLDTGLSGPISLKRYQALLSHLETISHFTSHARNKELIKNLNLVLNNIIAINQHIPRDHDTPLTQDQLSKTVNQFTSEIDKQLDMNGFAYFTPHYSYKTGQLGSGHALGCKVVKEKERIIVLFFNLGEGIDKHVNVDAATTHYKICPAYPPAILTQDDWQKNKQAFFAHLIRYEEVLPKNARNYQSTELYDLLHMFGKIDPTYLASHALTLAATAQRVGNCVDKSVRNLLCDYAVWQFKGSRDEIHRLFLDLHFSSLLMAYHVLKDDLAPPPHHRELLRLGTQEFAICLRRYRPLITSDEYFHAAEVVDLILHEIAPGVAFGQPLSPMHFKGLPTEFFYRYNAGTDSAPSYKPLNPPVAERHHLIPRKNEPPVFTSMIPTQPPFQPHRIKEDLKALIDDLKAKPRDAQASLVTYVLSSQFPIPSPTENPWSLVPEGDREEVMAHLLELTERLSSLTPIAQNHKLLYNYTIYAIADSIARLDPRNRLKGWVSSCRLKAFEQVIVFTNPHLEKRYCDLIAYFQSISVGKEIFSRCGYIDTAKAFNTIMSATFGGIQGDKITPEAAHLLFLSQFHPVPCQTAEDFAKLLAQNPCPSQVKILQRISLIAQVNDHKINDEVDYTVCEHILEIQDASTNATLFTAAREQNRKSFVLSNIKLHPVYYAQLLEMAARPQLKVALAMKWIAKHYDQLHFHAVQKVLLSCFFTPQTLKHALETHPHLVLEFRQIVEQGVIDLQKLTDPLPSFTFLIQLAVKFEEYAAMHQTRAYDTALLVKYRETLTALIADHRLENHEHAKRLAMVQPALCYIDKFLQPASVDSFIDTFAHLLTWQLYTDTHAEYYDNDLYKDQRATNHSLIEALRGYLRHDDGSRLSAIMNGVMQKLFPTQKPPFNFPWKWDEGGCVVRCEKFVVDLGVGQVYHPDPTLKYRLTALHSKNEQRWAEEHGCGHIRFWWYGQSTYRDCSMFVSIDDTLAFYFRDVEEIYPLASRIFKKKAGDPHFLTLAAFDKRATREDLFFLKAMPLTHQITASKAGPTATTTVTSFATNQLIPYMESDFTGDKITVYKVDANGKRLPWKLASLKDLHHRHPLYPYTLRFAPYDEIYCFVDSKGEAQEIHFVTLGLTFRRDAKGNLCPQGKEFEGYYWSPQTIDALGEELSQEVFVLRNQQGKIKLLLHYPYFQPRILFGAPDDPAKLQRDTSRPFITYDLDSAHSPLQVTTLSQRLFLLYYYKTHNCLDKAFSELKKFHLGLPFDRECCEIFELFLHLPDNTPKSLAFNMKLLYLVAERYSSIAEEDLKIVKNFLIESFHWYSDYFRTLDDEEFGSIPKELRLTEREEERILRTLEREGIAAAPIAWARLDFYKTKSHSTTFQFLPQKINQTPSIFREKKITPPNELRPQRKLSNAPIPYIPFPSRVSPGYLSFHFNTLYEQARNAPFGKADPFDFTLLALFKLKDERDNLGRVLPDNELNLARLLFWIRSFSDNFSDLDMTKGATFDQIVTRVQAIAKDPRYPSFVEAFNNQSVTFRVERINPIIVVPKEQMEALFKMTTDALCPWSAATTVEELKKWKGAHVMPAELKRFEGYRASLPEGDPMIAVLDEIVKSFIIVDRHFIRMPSAPLLRSTLDSLVATKTHLLVTEEEFETIRSQVGSLNIARYRDGVALWKLIYCACHQRTLERAPKEENLPLPPLPARDIGGSPFHLIGRDLFGREEAPLVAPRQLFSHTLFPKEPDVFELTLINKIVKGHVKDCAQTKMMTTMNQSKLSSIRTKLLSQVEALRKERIACQETIECALNRPFESKKLALPYSLEKERAFQLALNSCQTYTLTAEQVMREVILRNDRSLLTQERPMLGEKEIAIVVREIMGYYHLLLLEKMAQKGVELTNALLANPHDIESEEQLDVLLHYEFKYDPMAYPEITLFMATTGLLLRPDQIALHKWVAEGLEKGENRAFQAPAGGGKTTVLGPLFKLRCQRYPMGTLHITHKAIHKVERDEFNRTMQLFGDELAVVEIDMHSDFTLAQLKRMVDDFASYPTRRKGVHVPPQTYYALRLICYRAAFDPAEKEKAEEVTKILNLLQERFFFFIDEAHLNQNPNTKAISGMGEMMMLEPHERGVVFNLMRPIIGLVNLPCGPGSVSALSGVRHPSKTPPSDSEMATLREALAKHLATIYLQSFAAPLQAEFLKYWLDKKVSLPHFPDGTTETLKKDIALIQFCLCDLLPQALRMKTNFDFIASPAEGGIYTPAHHKLPSHAQFKDPFLTLILTIIGSVEEGLTLPQMKEFIAGLQEQDKRERMFLRRGEESPTAQMFNGWMKTIDPKVKLREVRVSDEVTIGRLHTLLKKDLRIIEWFLYAFVFQHVRASSEQFTSTPAHLLHGGKASILFTATPLPQESLPMAFTTPPLLDETFEGRVVARACEEQHFIHPESVDKFFEEMHAKKQHDRDLRVMIDAGGYLAEFRNEEVAERWLKASLHDAILFFNDRNGSASQDFALMVRDKSHKGYHVIEKEALVAMKALQVSNPKANIATYFDSAHSQSANISQKAGTVALVFGGDSTTCSHLIQSIMRLRGFLNKRMKQRIVWALPPKLRDKMKADARIAAAEKLTVEAVFAYALRKEAMENRKGMLLAAYQEIVFRVERLILSESKNLSETIQRKVKGFKEKMDARATVDAVEVVKQSESVLRAFASDLYARFHEGEAGATYDAINTEKVGATPAESARIQLKKDIEMLIANVKSRIPLMRVDYLQNAATQMHMKVMMWKQTQKVFTGISTKGFKPELPRAMKPVTAASFAEKGALRAQTIFATIGGAQLSPHLYFEERQLHTATDEAGVSQGWKFMKDIDFIVIVPTGGPSQFAAEAASNDSLNIRLGPLCHPDLRLPDEAFVVDSDGNLVPTKKFSPAQKGVIDTLLATPEMRGVLEDVAVLNGQIPQTPHFEARRKAWGPSFADYFTSILQAKATLVPYSETGLRGVLYRGDLPPEVSKQATIEVL